MTTILIVEGNTPDMVAVGHAGANGFIRTFSAVAPEVRIHLANPYAAPLRPEELHGIDGVVLTGSGVRWSVDAPEAAPQRAAAEVVLASGTPVWGSCNGLQLAMLMLGGSVGASPIGMEVGMAQNNALTREGVEHPMMAGRRSGFGVPCIHRDEVQVLPEGATLLAGNGHSPVQAAVYEKGNLRFWGTQYHPELSLADIGVYVRARGIFADHANLADDLELAETDSTAATRLGTHPDALVLPQRSRELSNWLQFVSGG
ncbi:type 1 glutamine amidotransferase [Ruegeria sp. Ofav3-42]|uniref:type 1 glutamine amidotransferase n=1 Tax=Ruegeria sp. Ofav3-42 TaxID=2917759 RepID=UPI001EF4F34A|nr:type 1 glutamine amidotransferase [Ruegeria sp. Ofav3-42]MCG7520273.1 type 1 glutamine amidotransferase [Ruegeria sp. Ofav3-42]